MTSETKVEQSQDKKKDNEKPVANGIKKDEPEELVIHPSRCLRILSLMMSRVTKTRI
jgi:hypothetical protein